MERDLTVPASTSCQRRRTSSDGRKEGIKIAREALLELRECLQGVYVMPMFGRYDSAAEVIEGIKAEG